MQNLQNELENNKVQLANIIELSKTVDGLDFTIEMYQNKIIEIEAKLFKSTPATIQHQMEIRFKKEIEIMKAGFAELIKEHKVKASLSFNVGFLNIGKEITQTIGTRETELPTIPKYEDNYFKSWNELVKYLYLTNIEILGKYADNLTSEGKFKVSESGKRFIIDTCKVPNVEAINTQKIDGSKLINIEFETVTAKQMIEQAEQLVEHWAKK